MRNKKILTITITVIIVSIIIIGAVSFFISNYGGNYKKNIYGDNSKIITEYDTYSYNRQVCNNTDGKLKSKFRFTGMDTIYKLDSEDGGVASIKYNVNITSGKFKIVLINPNDEITTVIEGTGEGTKDIELSSGESRIKLVGKDAKGEIEIDIDSNDYVKTNHVSN